MPWIAVDTKGHILKWPWRFVKEHVSKHRKHKALKPQPVAGPVQPIEMYDDIAVNLLPVPAKAYAGYVDGKWPTYAQLVKKYGHTVHLVSIAVFPSDNADVLDVEPGDATIAQAADWVKRQHARGNPTPDVYTAASWGEKLIDSLTKAGLVYGKDYRWWSAHYTYKPHLCGPACGFGLKHVAHATQWTDKAGGKSLDESLCSADFFPKGTQV